MKRRRLIVRAGGRYHLERAAWNRYKNAVLREIYDATKSNGSIVIMPSPETCQLGAEWVMLYRALWSNR